MVDIVARGSVEMELMGPKKVLGHILANFPIEMEANDKKIRKLSIQNAFVPS